MPELKNIEILKVGTWNNTPITHSDLEEIVNNFDKVGYKAPIKLGHADAPGDRAFGWISRVWKMGEVLMADFADIPEKVFEAIKDHGYDAVSSEIFFNLKRGGDVFKRALGAVALLGSRIPAVAGLKPLRESLNLSEEDSFESVVSVQVLEDSTKHEGFKMSKEEMEALQARLQELETKDQANAAKLEEANRENERNKTKISVLEQDNQNRTIELKLAQVKVPAFVDFLKPLYQFAMNPQMEAKFSIGEAKELSIVSVLDKLVEKVNKDSEVLFTQTSSEPDNTRREVKDNADKEVDRLALAYSAEKNVDYADAVRAILAEEKNADLKARYLSL